MRVRTLLIALLLVALLCGALVGPAFAQQPGGRDQNGGRTGGRNGNNNNNDACSGRHRRACEIPEVPIAAAIPAAGLLAVAGYVLVDHRRRSGATSTRA